MLLRLRPKRLPVEAIKALRDYVRKYGWVCYYTRMALDVTDPHSPWYCVFDHWIPNDNRKIVITSALINEMKADLSEKEFWCLIIMLASLKRNGTKVRKIKLRYWNRDEDPYSFGNDVHTTYPLKGYRKCIVCGKRIQSAYFNNQYCSVCGFYVERMRIRRFSPQTIADICKYIHKKGYKCFFTGMSLEVKNYKSPWHCVLAHLVPGDFTKIVLTSAVVSVLKAGLTEKDFWYYVLQMADYKEKGRKIRKKNLASWFRLCPADDV